MRRFRKPQYVHDYRDRHGKKRIYFRKPGRSQVPLPSPLYSEAFWTAYHKALADDAAPLIGVARAKAGTMSALIADYYQSAEWKTLAESSQTTYRAMLERFRIEYGDLLVAGMETHHVNKIIDKVADRPAAANNLRDRLNVLMRFAVGAGYRKDNPVLFAKKVKHVAMGFRTWTEGEIGAFRNHWLIGSPQRIAMEVLLFTGLRRSDAVRLGRQHVQDGSFVLYTKKSQGRVKLEIPIHLTLRQHLDLAPTGCLTYITTKFGKPRSAKAFTNWFSEAAHQAGLPPHSSPHGLRKAACRRLAEAGCTPHQIMAITGHKNLREVETYTKEFERRKLALSGMGAIIDMFPVAETGTDIG
jgi:integrase